MQKQEITWVNILISGKKFSGKDTCADIFESLIPQDETSHVYRFSWAKYLKEFLIAGQVISKEQAYQQDFKETESNVYWSQMPNDIYQKYHSGSKAEKMSRMTAREVMQVFGTEMCRGMLLDNFWINSLRSEQLAILNSLSEGKHTVFCFIPDTRFPNEIEYEFSPELVNINSLKFTLRVKRPSLESSDVHVSEKALDDFNEFDFDIVNDKSLNDLSDEVNKVYEIIKDQIKR